MKSKLLAFFKTNWKALLSISSIFLAYAAYNYILVLHPSTALTDWLDYPLIVFILEQNIKHLSQLDFANIANISSFYPSPGGMFFTEVMFIQGIVGTLLFPFTKNYILTHNIIFFLTALANIVALQYFWSKIFKNQLIISVLSMLFVFSPYYFSMYVHFQMIGYAFFFFSAARVLSATNKKDFFWAGVLSGLQFLVGVYLGIYSLVFTGIFLVWKLWKTRKLKDIFVWGSMYTAGFTLIAGYFVYMFAKVKAEYAIERDAGFYVDLALQPTDWLFNPYDSVWSRTVYKAINAFGHRHGPHFSPGWVLIGSAAAGLMLALKKKRRTFTMLMLLVLGWGIMAGLGPRLTVNGQYYGTLLPYAVFLKFTPFFDALRATGRWFFFIQIGLLFFVGVLLEQLSARLTRKAAVVAVVIGLLLYGIEMVPLTQRTEAQSYRTPEYEVLSDNCKQGNVLLEYPFGTNTETNATQLVHYWSNMLLNQMHHDCYIVNGYSGFDPQHYLDYKQSFEEAVQNEDSQQLEVLLNQKNVTFLKINKNESFESVPESLLNFAKSNHFSILYENQDYLVVHQTSP